MSLDNDYAAPCPPTKYTTYAVVHGRDAVGLFDMLRYDAAHFVLGGQLRPWETLGGMLADHDQGSILIGRRINARNDWRTAWTNERWRSFGFEITPVTHHEASDIMHGRRALGPAE